MLVKTEEFISKAILKHGSKYDYSKVTYTNASTKIIIICPEHGEFEQTPHNHLKGYGCRNCGITSSINSRSFNTNNFINKSNKIHNYKYDYSKTEYYHNKQKVAIICKEHGEFKQTPNSHLSGQGCPICGISKQRDNMLLTIDEFIEKSGKIHNKYNYSKVQYINNKSPVIIICPIHGEFEQKPYHHLRGQGCVKCGISSCHTTILCILKDYEIEINDRSLLNGKEIDVWIPSEKLAIEINGCYWHGHKRSKRSSEKDKDFRNIHLNKLKSAQDKQIKLLQFWDYEINCKKDIVRSMIMHRLNRSERRFARSLQIEECDNNYVKNFINESHLQGHRNASVNYILKEKDDIFATLTFSKHTKHEWEIIRYACKLNTAVIGGFSRLLKKFIKDYNPTEIMTFADARYSVGDVYSKNGFIKIDHTEPNYFYFKNSETLSRQKCQKHKLSKLLPVFKAELSETENMLENGYVKVYDAGHLKLIWQKQSEK